VVSRKTVVVLLGAIVCGLALLGWVGGPALGRAQTVSPETVERASADDCAVIVEIGKARLNWGATPPKYDFFPEFDRVGGGVYREICPWKKLGVAKPRLGTPNSEKSFFITRPEYSGARASATLQIALTKTVDGKKMPPFLMTETCTLEKPDGRWQLVECKLKAIT
jgi:hypothetical protein